MPLVKPTTESELTTSNRTLKRAFKIVLAVQLVVLLTVVSSSLYFAKRANESKENESEARLNAQKIEKRIQRITTIADAQEGVRLAWKLENESHQELTSVLENFSKATLSVLTFPLFTLSIVGYALWSTRESRTKKELLTTGSLLTPLGTSDSSS